MYSQDVPTTAAPDHESASRMTEEETSTDDAADPGMKLDRLTVRPAENGGFIVDCSKLAIKPPKKGDSINSYSSKDYAFSTKEDLFAFLQKELA
jgi:hypothetical protein